MKKRVLDLRDENPLLDIAAYARKGRLPTPAERLHISLTVHRAPEVMVKVSGGARTLSGVERHLAYIGRNGELSLGIDANGKAAGKGFERGVVRDWNLDVDALQNHTRNSAPPRKSPKLVHNIIFSMPPGTSPSAVWKAVRKLALNEWALQHRYAMALHTDHDHPHVHVVLKAVSERGVRLNIRKATLRAWRSQFAANLRQLSVDANATERAVRRQSRAPILDGIFRANLRGQSSHMSRRRAAPRVSHVANSESAEEIAGERKLLATRNDVTTGWRKMAAILAESGDSHGADDIRRFEAHMQPVKTEARLTNEHAFGSPQSTRERGEPN